MTDNAKGPVAAVHEHGERVDHMVKQFRFIEINGCRDQRRHVARHHQTTESGARDDDAVEPTPQLERLLKLSEAHAVPLTIAVIPAHATSALQRRLSHAQTATIVQHGYAHANRAGNGKKKSEYPSSRSERDVRGEIAQGQERLGDFIRRAPVFVPPWNRYAEGLPRLLGELGFEALSAFGTTSDVNHIQCLNCHADVTAWRSTREFAGDDAVTDSLTRDLMRRRSEKQDRGLPTGLLTHHLVHDQRSWAFIDQLFGVTRAHRAVRWITTANALGAIDANPGDGA